jgi:hypothetical protein
VARKRKLVAAHPLRWLRRNGSVLPALKKALTARPLQRLRELRPGAATPGPNRAGLRTAMPDGAIE